MMMIDRKTALHASEADGLVADARTTVADAMTDFQPTSTFTAPLTAPTQGGTSSTNKPAPYPQLLATIGSALGIAEPPPIPPTTTRLVAIAVQPHGLLHPPSQHRLCAAALADDSLAMYNLQTNQWSPHKLANSQQKRVAAVAWQPHASSCLAVGCARGQYWTPPPRFM